MNSFEELFSTGEVDMQDFYVAMEDAPTNGIYERYDRKSGRTFVIGVEDVEKQLPDYGRYAYDERKLNIMIMNNAGCSCGVFAINGLSVVNRDPKLFFRSLLETYKIPHDLTIVFSDNMYYGNGKKLAEYIRKHNMGDLVELPPGRNPNSGNTIVTWLWRFDLPRVTEFMTLNLEEKVSV